MTGCVDDVLIISKKVFFMKHYYNSCQMKSRINFFNVLFFKGKAYKVR